MMNRRQFIQFGAGGIIALSSSAAFAQKANTAQLRILATTDLHSFLTDFDYYKDAPTDKFGLVRTASLIDAARKEVKNSVLVDNGDLIQGNPIADYQAAKGSQDNQPEPSIMALNALQYDVGTLGNHEFNYGLDYLQSALSQAKFPIINSNVVKAGTDEPYFQPTFIQEKKILDQKGKTHTLKIGYFGVVPPQVMIWDKANLEGKVEARDIVKTAQHYAKALREQGADLVVALAHTGPSSEPYQEGAENCAFYLADIAEIDAVIFGHAHRLFPNKEFEKTPDVDLAKGTVKGKPEAMAGYWGNHLSVIDLTLAQDKKGKFKIKSAQAAIRPIFDNEKKQSVAPAHESLSALLKDVHEATRTFVNQPIGAAKSPMYSYLALIQDDPTVQIVNQAQSAYVRELAEKMPELQGLPILSAGAPFKAGGRKNDPSGYTEVDAGTLSYRNAADLYLYPNTLVVVKVTGAELKEWLEASAGMFNLIDVNQTEPQFLINWEGFRTYNFDVIDGVNYQIDVTQPARYDGDLNLVNHQAERIVNLTFDGKPVDPKALFLIATNNYRAYGGKFAGTGADHVVFASPDENRQILANYIKAVSEKEGAVEPKADNNWQFAPIHAQSALDIRVESNPSDKAKAFIEANARYPMSFQQLDDVGFAVYQIDLGSKV